MSLIHCRASVAEVPDLPTDGTEAPRDPKGDLLKQLVCRHFEL